MSKKKDPENAKKGNIGMILGIIALAISVIVAIATIACAGAILGTAASMY